MARLRTAVAALAMLAVLGLLAAAPAEAARECEDPAYVPSVGACARLPGAEIYYRDTGDNHAGQRPTIVFLHANSGNADAFEKQFEAFANWGFRAIAYDRKNYGRSSNTLRDLELGRPPTTWVDDLDNLANHLGLETFHLVAVAAGAQAALEYAAVHPQRVLSLTLAATLGPAGLAANEPQLLALQRAIALPYEVFCPGPIPAPLPAGLRTISPVATTIPAIRQEHRELGPTFRATDPAGVARYHEIDEHARHRTFDGCRTTSIGANQPPVAAALRPNTFAKLQSLIPTRTLLLAGTADFFYAPPVHMRLWGSYISDVQYVQLDTGHAPQFEDPAAFNAAVLRFLRGGYPFELLRK